MKHLLTFSLLFFTLLASTMSHADGHLNNHEKHPQKTVILVHGAFADGSSWNKVIPILQKNGLKTIAVQNPLTSLQDDVEFTQRAIAEAKGPVILVGHSWGGMVITEAGNNPQVESLVYVSAIAPTETESINDILNEHYNVKKNPAAPGFAKPIIDEQGYIRLSEQTILDYFAEDLPKAEAMLIASTQGRFYKGTLSEKVTTAAWKTKPSWYIVSSNDQMIAPSLLRAMADTIQAKTYELPSSHVPMLSKPQEVANIIMEAANLHSH